MSTMTVNGRRIDFTDEKNILQVVRKAGIELPSFCYQDHLSAFGACRMCVVDAGKRGIITSCTAPPEDGLEIHTHTERVMRVRRMSLEHMLAAHDRECLTCGKSGECKLQDLSERLGIKEVRFSNSKEDRAPIDDSNPSLVRDPNKCILCGLCVRVCQEMQGLRIVDFSSRGSKVHVGPAFGKRLDEVECTFCGQCASVCPTGAITVKPESGNVFKALNDPERKVVFHIAPAVRVGLGEYFGLKPGTNVEGKIAAALRFMGAHRVFDTDFAADLTVMEEGQEFINRLRSGENLPIFTSCCPAWVKTAEQHYPELLPLLSSCRSPQQMFGSVMKKYFAPDNGMKPEEVYVVSVMPCSAKKFEAQREEFRTDGVRDVDAVITTQELARMIKGYGIDFNALPDEPFDPEYGESTGAGVIFGATGGVAEAALRTAYKLITGNELELGRWETAGAGESVREMAVDINGEEIRIATVNGLAEAHRLIEEMKDNGKKYHMVEVMACPSGCVGGAGQHSNDTLALRACRAKGLAEIDSARPSRRAHENIVLGALYKNHLGERNGEEAHHSLHTHYSNRRRIDETITLSEGACGTIVVCVGTSCFQHGAYQTMQKLNKLLRERGLSGDVEIKATFCFEKCGKSPNIAVNGKIISSATPDKIEKIFEKQILPALKSRKEPAVAGK